MNNEEKYVMARQGIMASLSIIQAVKPEEFKAMLEIVKTQEPPCPCKRCLLQREWINAVGPTALEFIEKICKISDPFVARIHKMDGFGGMESETYKPN